MSYAPPMAEGGVSAGEPHDEIVRLEKQIAELSDRLESCRKFILAGRIAACAGGVALVALLFGVVAFDPRIMACAAAAFLGGLVAWGANSSTADEANKELAAAESRRTTLIGTMDLRVVGERPTLH